MIATIFRLPCLAVALALSFLLTLTGYHFNQFKTNTAQVAQLVLVSPSDPSTFNYALNNSPYSVFGYIYSGLLMTNGITAELEPALAESWQISADKRRITFTLREDLISSGQMANHSLLMMYFLPIRTFTLTKKFLLFTEIFCVLGVLEFYHQ